MCWLNSPWHNENMRIFIPATISELAQPTVPAREGVEPVVTLTGADAAEVADFEATEDASILSLELLRENPGEVARRVVLAVEIPAGTEPKTGISWGRVKAILVDGAEAEPFVTAACAAQTQEEADTAVASVLECALEWYAPEERSLLLRLAE